MCGLVYCMVAPLALDSLLSTAIHEAQSKTQQRSPFPALLRLIAGFQEKSMYQTITEPASKRGCAGRGLPLLRLARCLAAEHHSCCCSKPDVLRNQMCSVLQLLIVLIIGSFLSREVFHCSIISACNLYSVAGRLLTRMHKHLQARRRRVRPLGAGPRRAAGAALRAAA